LIEDTGIGAADIALLLGLLILAVIGASAVAHVVGGML
jgi:hypothetical protein